MTRSIILFAGSIGLVAVTLVFASIRNPDLWSSPDQRGDRLMHSGKFADAANEYADPRRRGTALYRAGDFRDAAAAFASVSTPESIFDRGNALVMLGKYSDAVKSYDRALVLRPGWKKAEENRVVAIVRRDRMDFKGGESGDSEKSDKIVFEKGKKNPNGEKTEVAGDKPLTDEELRGLWLRRVQTKPADFLRAKFAFQVQEAAP